MYLNKKKIKTLLLYLGIFSCCFIFFYLLYIPAFNIQSSKSYRYFTESDIYRFSENIKKRKTIPIKIYLIGHKGMSTASGKNIELKFTGNTIPAFKESIICGADGLELDLFVTKDNFIVVAHNDELQTSVHYTRDTNQNSSEGNIQRLLKINQKELSEIQQFVLNENGDKIPTFQEVMELCSEGNHIRKNLGMSELILNIDLKESGIADRVIEFLVSRDDQIEYTFYFTSSDKKELKRIKDRKLFPLNYFSLLQVSTAKIYGINNVNKEYIISDPNSYNQKTLNYLDESIKKHQIDGIDIILWDINEHLLKIIRKNSAQLHLYASNLELYNDPKRLAAIVSYLSDSCTLYLKTDNVSNTINLIKKYANSNEKANSKYRLKLIDNLPYEKVKINERRKKMLKENHKAEDKHI